MAKRNLEDSLEKELHVSRLIIIYKFSLGLIEIILGLGVIFFGQKVLDLYQNYKYQELFEDPHDLLVNLLDRVVPFAQNHQSSIIIILFLLGFVKIIGSIGLLYHKHWGLDLLIVLTIALLPFEAYHLLSDPNLTKTAYFFINILIALYLVNFRPKEYFVNVHHRIKHRRF
ncbi:DUF2127 domain-containing protein [Patescibacteria group bacterium]|nr:DUF2127 domain-containing protein [Patescibacteria group bacterium]MCL5409682.1 DUF2127 domain-containing protein [Patescibacteria group bacterium]